MTPDPDEKERIADQLRRGDDPAEVIAEARSRSEGVADFAKKVLRAGMAAAEAPTVVPMPDITPGIRWLRKHRHETNPKATTMCSCAGCHCTRLSVFKLPCFQCAKGEHRRSTLSKRKRRERAEVAMIRVQRHRSIRKPKRVQRAAPARRRKAAARG